jgi:hypothetical protein
MEASNNMTKTLEEQLLAKQRQFTECQKFWLGYIGDTDAWVDTEISVMNDEERLSNEIHDLRRRIQERNRRRKLKDDKWN